MTRLLFHTPSVQVTAVIFNNSATAHWCAPNDLQVGCRNLGKGHILVSLGAVIPWLEGQCTFLTKQMMCLNYFSTFSVCHEAKKIKNHWVIVSHYCSESFHRKMSSCCQMNSLGNALGNGKWKWCTDISIMYFENLWK